MMWQQASRFQEMQQIYTHTHIYIFTCSIYTISIIRHCRVRMMWQEALLLGEMQHLYIYIHMLHHSMCVCVCIAYIQ